MHKKFAWFSIILLLSVSLEGQDKGIIDSLITELELPHADSVRSKLFIDVASHLIKEDTILANTYLEKALELSLELERHDLAGRVHELHGEMHIHYGMYNEAIMLFDRALAAYHEAHDNAGYYETLKDKGNAYLYLSEFNQAMQFYETALDYYRRNSLNEGASKCLNNMGIIYKNRGEYVEALTVYDESLALIDPEEDPMQVAKAYINKGNIFVYLGSYDQALVLFQDALSIAESEGGDEDYALCLLNTGVVQNKCRNFQEADELYRRSMILFRELENPLWISNCLINIGTNYSEMGKLEEALEYVEQGLVIRTELGDRRGISNCYNHLAGISYKMEDYETSLELYTKAVPIKEELVDLEGLTQSLLGQSTVHLARQEYSKANQMADRALEIAREIGTLEHVAAGLKVKEEIAAKRGDYQRAYLYALESIRIGDSLMDESTSKAVMEMEFRHQSRALAKENENLRIQSTLSAELMRKRAALMYSAAGIALLLTATVILGVYFIRRIRQASQKLEEKNLVITRQNLKLDNLNRTKDRMMSIIAHDLRGTIGNQLTAIEVLHRVESSSQQTIDKKKLLGNLKHSASYSLELLENLLHWSRLEENENYFHPEDINLALMVQGCVSLFDETARNKGLQVHQEVDKAIRIKADRIMLEIILRNLLSNSIKFSEKDKSIWIKALKEDGRILLKLKDEGIGMTEEQIQKVLHNGGYSRRGTANEKGAGIGMTLVREFTALHQGVLEIDSKPGVGTTTVVSIPHKS